MDDYDEDPYEYSFERVMSWCSDILFILAAICTAATIWCFV